MSQRLTFMHCFSIYAIYLWFFSLEAHMFYLNPQNLRGNSWRHIPLSFTSDLSLWNWSSSPQPFFLKPAHLGAFTRASFTVAQRRCLVGSKFPCGLLVMVPISTVEMNSTTMAHGQEQQEVVDPQSYTKLALGQRSWWNVYERTASSYWLHHLSRAIASPEERTLWIYRMEGTSYHAVCTVGCYA